MLTVFFDIISAFAFFQLLSFGCHYAAAAFCLRLASI